MNMYSILFVSEKNESGHIRKRMKKGGSNEVSVYGLKSISSQSKFKNECEKDFPSFDMV